MRQLPLALLVTLASLALAPHARAAEANGLPPCAPYLQDGRPGQITLVWRSATPHTSHVVVRDLLDHAVFERDILEDPQPEVVVTGLEPGTYYDYSVAEPGQEAFKGHFLATPDAKATHIRFSVMGDMGDGSPHQLAIAAQIARWKPEFMTTVGDNVYPSGAPDEFGKHFFEPYASLLANAVCYPTLGNHDVKTDNGAPYLSAFVLPPGPSNGRYYAFDDGPARFWMLDSNESLAPGSPQYEWLAADATNSTAHWKLAFFHHPPYSSGLHGQEAKNRRYLPPLFTKLGFDAVFTGHDHHYERSKPIGGVTYFVTGGGGAMLYGTSEQPFTAAKSTAHEFLGVTIFQNRLSVAAIGEKGEVLDTDTLEHPDG